MQFSQFIIRALSVIELRTIKSKVQLFEVLEPFTAMTKLAGDVVVPKGLLTDFASVPRIARMIINVDDPWILFPSLVHDYLYDIQGKLPDRTLTRQQCDQVLAELIDDCGGSPWYIKLVYYGVRLGGYFAWKNKGKSLTPRQ